MSASADRNLLFGIVALQMDFISRDALIAGMNAWVLAKHRPLADILVEQGALEADHRALLEPLVQAHLAMHGNDAEKSLAALSSLGSAKNDLHQIADADVQASIAAIGSARAAEADDPFATRAQPTIGQSTSAGLRFRILRPHAEGGLGRVSVAEDGELHREVALKEIKDKFADHAEARSRFMVEAEITGGLEHPGIVPVYGLGTYADGRPFYAMRFIRGDSLKEAIQRFYVKPPRFDSLEFRQLLRRFIDVCNAIAYAHSRKVLHRDLKPGNIMLGKYGETLVVDWGLAKATDRSDTVSQLTADEPSLRPASGSGVAETQAGAAIGTPEYMSPEQAAGRIDLMGPPTDIYSLGATLYVILTGRPPVTGENVPDILHAVQHGAIEPPGKVNAAVPRALEAVCLKAMALKPGDRYVSALELAKEIEHWLADEPVTAWREPAGVRLRRWVRKHSRLVTGIGATLAVGAVALSVGLSAVERQRQLTAAQERETARERDEKAAALEVSQTRLAQVERGIDILASVFTNLDPLKEKKDGQPLRYLLSQQLDRATEQLTGEAVGDPLAVARLQLKLGDAQLSLGAAAQAIRLFEAARATFAAQLGSEHPDTLISMGNLAWGYKEAGQFDKALPLLEQTLKLSQAKLGPDHPNSLITMNNLALAYKAAGQLRRALPLLEEALKLKRTKLGPDHPDTLISMNSLAGGYNDAGQLDRALPLYEETLKLRRAKLSPDHPSTLISMNNLALGYRAAGRLDRALPLFEETLKLRRAKLGPDHPDTLMSMNNLALVFKDAGRLDRALPLDEEAFKLIRAKLGPDHPNTLLSMNNLATAYLEADQFDRAVPLLEETLKLRRAKLGPDHPDTLMSMANLAMGYRAAGQLNQCIPLLEEALKLARAKLGADHPLSLAITNNLAVCYKDAGQIDRALPLYEETLKLMRAKLGPNHPHTLISMGNLATGYQAAGQLDRALPLYEETLKLMRAKLGPDHPHTLTSINRLAEAFLEARQPEKGLSLLDEFLTGQKKRLGEDLRLAGFQASVAAALIKAKESAAAERILRECLVIREKLEPDAWTTFNTRSLLGGSLLGQKKYADAEPLLLTGYEGLKQRQDKIPKASRSQLTDALARLVQLYEANGPAEKADAWRAKLADAKAAEAPSKKP